MSHKVSDNKKNGIFTIASSPAYRSPPRRRIEPRALTESPSSHASPVQGSPGYDSPGHPSQGYAPQSPPVYGAHGYGNPYGSPPYGSPQSYYPPNYPPQFGYGTNNNFGTYPVSYGSTVQAYYAAPYPPSTYPYQGAPVTDPQTPVASYTYGSPNTQQYWLPAPYSFPAQQNWSPAPTTPDENSPTLQAPVVHSPAVETTEVPEDRSVTPTPSRTGPVVEQSVKELN